MPVQRCTLNGRPGWRWGQSGKCYTYTSGDDAASNEAKRKAHVQGYAATQHGAKALDATWIDDPALWVELRGVILPVVEPLFREAFITGAEMGAMQRPARSRPLAQDAADLFATGLRALDPQAATVLPYDFDAIMSAADETIGAYCVTPETRIQTLGLEWVAAGDLREGDEIVGFDETNRWRHARAYHPAVITRYTRPRLPVFEIELAGGERIRATGEHQWLATESSGGRGRGVRWIRTEDMATTCAAKLYLPRYMLPWEPATNYEAGFLAAAFDSEGSLSVTKGGTLALDFTQKDNALLARVKLYLDTFGFDWSEYSRPNGVHTLHLNGLGHGDHRFQGGMQERLRFLGMMRPPRLLDVYRKHWDEGRRAFGMRAVEYVGVERVDFIGEREIAAITSSTGTYLAEGFAAHNTDEWWAQFSASTQRQLRALIQRAERSGLTTAEVARSLEPIFGAVRAQRVAVSELTNLMGMGAQETYRRAGYNQWEWRTVQDSRVDTICRQRSRKRFPMSVPFRRAHVHCRCWPVPAGQVAVQPTLLDLLAS